MIKHDEIKNDSLYQCSECRSVVFGVEFDWFEDEPDLVICPVCDNHVEIFKMKC